MNPHELAITSMHQIGGGGGNPGLRACKRESATAASSMLDEALARAAFAPAGAKSLRRQQACLLKPHLHPRVPRLRFLQLAITSKKYRPCGRHLFKVVEAAGIEPASRSTLQTVLHT